MKKDQEIIKKSNIKLFLSTLLENRPISRTDLAKKTGMSPTSITRISSMLISKGFVIETDTMSRGVGRHAIMLDTVPGRAYSLGVEITSDSIKYAITDFHNNCVSIKSKAVEFFGQSMDELCKFIYEEALIFISENNIDYNKVISVGIAVSGIVNHQNNLVELSSQLKWRNQAVIPYLQPLFNKPVIIENDTKARIRGEKAFHNIPDGVDSAILVIAEGVSAAAINNENIVTGFKNAAGEIGHIALEPENGLLCDCGRKGCIQTRMAKYFLIEQAKEHDKNISSLEDIMSAYNNGTEWTADLLNNLRKSYRLCLDILESCYNPAVILVCGNVSEALRPLFEKWSDKYYKDMGRCISIILTGDKRNICAVGSSVIAMDTYITDSIGEITT